MRDLDDQCAVDALLARFDGFFDAVLVGVMLDLPSAQPDRRATLRLTAQERDGSWSTVTFSVHGLREFKFQEGRASNLVLSEGLGIHLLEDGTFVDLAPYTEQPASPAELRRSHQYVFGSTCSFDSLPEERVS